MLRHTGVATPASVTTKNPGVGVRSHLGRPILADDLADACYFLMQNYNDPGFVNIGVGHDIAIKDLAKLIKKIVGYEGEIIHDLSKPDGTPRKLMDVGKLHSMGWKEAIGLEEGIETVYREYAARKQN